MIFSILPASVTTLFLSTQLITSLTFQDDVRSFVYGGAKEEIFSELANSNKTLVLKAKKKDIDTNLIIVTSKSRYYFSVKASDFHAHQFIEIEDGIINANFRKVLTKESFDIFEGLTSVMVVAKKKEGIEVNGIKVMSKEYFSKGTPIIIDGLRIYN